MQWHFATASHHLSTPLLRITLACAGRVCLPSSSCFFDLGIVSFDLEVVSFDLGNISFDSTDSSIDLDGVDSDAFY